MRRFAGVVVFLASVGIALGTLSWAQPRPDAPKSGAHGHAEHHGAVNLENEFQKAISRSMTKMHDDMAAAASTGDPDQDFLAQMIPHHAGAVEMARLLLIHGRDPLVRRLAEEIIAGQQSEIQAMQARLHLLRARDGGIRNEFPAIGGTRGKD